MLAYSIPANTMQAPAILDAYVHTAPSPQNLVDIFAGEWSSALPPVQGQPLRSGTATLYEDARIHWAAQQLGGFAGKRILELGPLEAGHSYMLQQLGAASVLAVEANTRAYLKCLLAKELYGLSRVHFLCGDFLQFLAQTQEHYDVIFASGVLYHMADPLQLLRLIAAHTNQAFFWTHYYSAGICNANPAIRAHFTGVETRWHSWKRYRLHRREYGAALGWGGFCGAGATTSYWMERQDILTALQSYGFTQLTATDEEDERNHPNGPCLKIAASR